MTTESPNLNDSLFGTDKTRAMPTPALILAMIDSGDGISDLIFSPGRPPQVERHGDLVPVAIAELPVLRPEDTAGLACDLIDGNEQVLRTLKEQGACDSVVRAARAAAGSASTSSGSATRSRS